MQNTRRRVRLLPPEPDSAVEELGLNELIERAQSRINLTEELVECVEDHRRHYTSDAPDSAQSAWDGVEEAVREYVRTALSCPVHVPDAAE